MAEPGSQFEKLVSDFCKRTWDPSVVRENRWVENREVDIVIETPTELIIVECTIDRTKPKAENDISKIRETRRVLVGDAPQKNVRGFFITQHDPSPDVHKIAAENGSWIEACSFPSFVNKYNSSSTYIIERKKRPFGSVRHPGTDSIEVPRNQYVSVPFRAIGSSRELSVNNIVQTILNKENIRLVITGDFGIGKSMTLRELFYRLSEKYLDGETYRFPMYINLKDGLFDDNDDAVDLIERHAKWVGMRDHRDKLVHAWTSDCCIIFLDGFDEIARSGFARLTKSNALRWSSAHIVREIVKNSNQTTPILISGRESYFATFKEMRECLSAEKFSHASLHDLDDAEVIQLYRKILPEGCNPIIFGWLPQRPLLLSYLYFTFGEKLRDVHEASSGVAPGEGWNVLLRRLCERETDVARGATPDQIRRVIERIALFARTNLSEPGRVSSLQVAQAYRDVFEMEPEISVQQVLMRLPGLSGGATAEDRGFIDTSFFDAAQAGTLVEIIEALGTRDPNSLHTEGVKPILELLQKTRSVVTSLCAQIVVAALKQRETLGLLGIALHQAVVSRDFSKGNILGDMFMCALEHPAIGFRDELTNVEFDGAYFPELELNDVIGERRRITFNHCIIDRLEIDVAATQLRDISFNDTQVGHLNAPLEIADDLEHIGLGTGVEHVEWFDSTNADIFAMNVPRHFKVLKIVLRQLFQRQIAGRHRGVFFRGIRNVRHGRIEECLGILAKHNIVYFVGNPQLSSSLWYPNKAHAKRAAFLIDCTSVPNDILITELASR